jgi:hypothetical protein
MSAELIPFPCDGRTVRAIVVIPDGSGESDACCSKLGGFPLHEDEDLSFCGPLWWVMMMLKDYRMGLPVRVHPECERRACR